MVSREYPIGYDSIRTELAVGTTVVPSLRQPQQHGRIPFEPRFSPSLSRRKVRPLGGVPPIARVGTTLVPSRRRSRGERVGSARIPVAATLPRSRPVDTSHGGRSEIRRVAVRNRTTHSGSRTPRIQETEVPNSPTGRREDSESVRRFRPHPQRDRATFCRKLISIDREKA